MARRPRHISSTSIFFFPTLFLLAAFCATVISATEFSHEYGRVVGIDLGATYSRVAVKGNNTIEVIATIRSHQLHPTKGPLHKIPEDVLVPILADLHRDSMQRLLDNEHGPDPAVQAQLIEENATAATLRQLKEAADVYLNQSVTRAVIAVPPYLNDTRRQAVHDAASSVGLVVLRLISEPTAAIMAHGIDRQGGERRVLVYDIGGTTTSVSVVDVDDDAIEVLASGYVSIGGLDFDRRIADYIMALYHERTGINIGDDSPALERLMSEVELAKRRLSSEISTEVTIEAFGITRSFSEIITRNKLEELISDLIDKTVELCDRTLNDAEVWSGDSVRKLQNEDINDVILAGGSAHMPMIGRIFHERFNQDLNAGIPSEEAIVHGAAVLGSVFEPGNEINCGCVDVAPLTLGIETKGGLMTTLVPRYSIIPTRKSHVFVASAGHMSTVFIRLFQGERSIAQDNQLLTQLELAVSLPPAPGGRFPIEVTLDVDMDEIRFTVTDLQSRASNSTVITKERGSSFEETVASAATAAERYLEQDQAWRSRVQALNSLAALTRHAPALIKVPGGRIGAAGRRSTLAALAEATEWLQAHSETASVEEVEATLIELQGAVRSATSKIDAEDDFVSTIERSSRDEL